MSKKIKEETVSGDIPTDPVGPTGKMADGRDFFSCDHNEDLFWTLHTKIRKHRQWYKTHIGDENITNWARQPKNKNKSFYLKYQDMFRKIKNSY